VSRDLVALGRQRPTLAGRASGERARPLLARSLAAEAEILLAGSRVAADGRSAEALRPDFIDEAYGLGVRMVSLDGVTQPVAWSRRP
jgi:hypothetical protein